LIRKVSCVIQVVWIIPEELIKRVSQARFLTTLCLLGGFVNYSIIFDAIFRKS